jgi:prepilin-type N-terminal cleavage/methylation domain-containing protein
VTRNFKHSPPTINMIIPRKRQRFGKIRAARGFTLIEVIFTILLLGIIGAIGSQMLEGGFSAYFASKDAAEVNGQRRIALERMTRDILRLRSSASTDLTMNPATQLALIDYDGTSISYALSGTTLTRNGTPLADGISGLQFSYLKSDGVTAATQTSDVFFITVEFTASRNAITRLWSTTLHPRNL